MSGLQWVRVDGSIVDHPKILDLLDERNGGCTAFVWVCSLAYAGSHGTNGYVPRNALSRLHGRKLDAERLVTVGLWEVVEGGWYIHDWGEYQQTTETSDEVKAKRRAASAKGNCKKYHGSQCECWRKQPAVIEAAERFGKSS